MKLDYKQIVDEVLSKNFWRRIIIMVFSSFILAFNYNMWHYSLLPSITHYLLVRQFD